VGWLPWVNIVGIAILVNYIQNTARRRMTKKWRFLNLSNKLGKKVTENKFGLNNLWKNEFWKF
jgi:hypothetical protein